MREFWVKDLSLARQGEKRIAWSETQMPVLRRIAERFGREKPLKGFRIGACLHITTDTGVLMRALSAGGAELYLCASNPLSTQDDVAAALANEGVHVYGFRGQSEEDYYKCLGYVIRARPEILMDDGADLISATHKLRYGVRSKEMEYVEEVLEDSDIEEFVKGILGGSEETTTGVIRLKALAREGRLLYPVIAVNDADSKRLFDNPVGTGQSALDGIIRATNILLAGKDAVVAGFGNVGSGIAHRLRGMGARVTVVEVDPIKALRALMDGFSVEPMSDAARHGELFITATGNIDVIRKEHFQVMRDGAILANAGHFNVEISRSDLEGLAVKKERLSPCIERFILKDGRRIYLLAEGRLVNLACAEGHPSEVMDMSFGLQALSAEYLARNGGRLPRDVLRVPEEIDRSVAAMKLEAMGIRIEKLTEKQRRYLTSWILGT